MNRHPMEGRRPRRPKAVNLLGAPISDSETSSLQAGFLAPMHALSELRLCIRALARSAPTHFERQASRAFGAGEGALSLYRWRESITNTPIDGLHEVEVVVENAKTGKTIYELRSMLFDPPISSSLNESSGQRDRETFKKRDRRAR